MYSRTRNAKNQFIGRRTGQNVLPGKTVRKREDGTDMFQDYWTDSENDITTDMICSIVKSSVSKKNAPNAKEHNVNEPNIDENVIYETVVTDVVEIQTEELIYSSEDFAIQQQKSFNQTITIRRSEEENNESTNLKNAASPHKLNETRTIQHDSAIDHGEDTPQDSVTKKLNIMSENSTNVENNSISRNIDLPCTRKSATFNKTNTSSVESNLGNEELAPEISNVSKELNHTLSPIKGNKRKASSVELNSNNSDISNDSKENDASKAKAKKSSGKVKAASKKLQKRKSEKPSDIHLSEQQVQVEEITDDIHQSVPEDVLETIPEDVFLNGTDRDQMENFEEVDDLNTVKGSSNVNKSVSQLLSESKKTKKKKSKAVSKPGLDDDNGKEPGCRRSARQRHAPLKFWTNERLQYRYTESGSIQCLGVACESKRDELAFDKVRPKKKKFTDDGVPRSKNVRPHKRPSAQSQSYLEKGVLVIDDETKEQVYVSAVVPHEDIIWRAPKTKSRNNRYEIGKSYMMENATYGFLRLKAMQKKPLQYLPGYDAIFIVIEGQVEVIINRTPVLVSERDTFFVPKGNPYAVTNLLDSDAVLHFMATNHSYLEELKKSD